MRKGRRGEAWEKRMAFWGERLREIGQTRVAVQRIMRVAFHHTSGGGV